MKLLWNENYSEIMETILTLRDKKINLPEFTALDPNKSGLIKANRTNNGVPGTILDIIISWI